MSLRQAARAYYDAAQNAMDIVKPLLIFYGANSLAKAIILSKRVPERLSNLAQGHGISTDWSNPTSLESIAVKINPSGTFAELLDTCTSSSFLLPDKKYVGIVKTAGASDFQGNELGAVALISQRGVLSF